MIVVYLLKLFFKNTFQLRGAELCLTAAETKQSFFFFFSL